MDSSSAQKLEADAIGPIPKSLQLFYREEELITVGCDFLGGGAVRQYFCFPPYLRSREDMGHVSSVQIMAAILEGGYCALEDAVLSEQFPEQVTPDWFYSTLSDWLALKTDILFRRAVHVGQVDSLELRVINIGVQRLRRRKLSATIEFNGFCSGETTWVIDPPSTLIF